MNTLTLILTLVALASVVVLYLAFKLFNSPDGERYRKQRMQGPFFPHQRRGNCRGRGAL